MAITKVKLPNNEIKPIGALSSNIIFNGDGVTTTLNDKIAAITPVLYTISMTGNTLTLTGSNGTTSTVTFVDADSISY